MKSSSRSVTLWFVAFVILLASAFVVPRLAGRGDQGLASGAAAALVFFALAGLAAVVAVVLLWITLRSLSDLSGGARVLGLLPIPILAVAAVLFWNAVQERSAAPGSAPATATPTSPVATPAP